MAEQREDLRAGQIVAMIANVNRDPKRRAKAWSPADFFPSLGGAVAKAKRSEEGLMAIARGLEDRGWGRVTTRAEREAEAAALAAEKARD